MIGVGAACVPTPTVSDLHLHLFGTPRLVAGDGRKLRFPDRRSIACLAVLAVDGPTARSRLAILLWDEQGEADARRNLRRELHRMREAGLDAAFVADAETVALAPGVATDLAALSTALEAGDAERVLELHAGGLLQGFDLAAAPAFADWLSARRETFARRWREIAERRCDALAEAGDLRGALREAHRLIADDSLQEAHFRRVMRLHQRLGEREAGLEAFERCRKALGRELGLRPLPETVALAEAIRVSEAQKAAAPSAPQAATLFRALVPEQPLLVGREPTIATIARQLAAGAPVAIEAAAGIGKSRLLGAARARSRRRGPCRPCQRCPGAVRRARPLAARRAAIRRYGGPAAVRAGRALPAAARARVRRRSAAVRPAAAAPVRSGAPGLAIVVRRERRAGLRRLAVRRCGERALVALVARPGAGSGRRRPAPGCGWRRGRRSGGCGAPPAAIRCSRVRPWPIWSRQACSASTPPAAGRRPSTTRPRTIASCRFRPRSMPRSPPGSADSAKRREPVVVDIHGTCKVGIKFEIKDSWPRNSDCELANWHLFVVHMGAYAKGRFGAIRVEPGKDMQRLIAALQEVGPAVADAVERYAPAKVKKVAEDAAKWVAESEKAKDISDATEVVLDKVKEETGVDIGAGAEKVVHVLVDPGGETSKEATERLEKEMAELNASHAEFQEFMLKSGLLTEFHNTLYRTAEEYNAIVDAKDTGGDWRSMAVALVRKCRLKKEAYLREQAEKKKREQQEAAAKAAAELARRIKESEAAMNAALTAANILGNPLNNRTQGQTGSKARKYWETGMNKYWSPGSAARLQCASLQGEARIAKAQEATALLVKARAVFQEGMRMIE